MQILNPSKPLRGIFQGNIQNLIRAPHCTFSKFYSDPLAMNVVCQPHPQELVSLPEQIRLKFGIVFFPSCGCDFIVSHTSWKLFLMPRKHGIPKHVAFKEILSTDMPYRISFSRIYNKSVKDVHVELHESLSPNRKLSKKIKQTRLLISFFLRPFQLNTCCRVFLKL